MHSLRPGPSCTRLRTVYTPCSRCESLAKLILAEPQGPSVEMLTYHCSICDGTEQFLMQS